MAVCSLQIHVHCSMTFLAANFLTGAIIIILPTLSTLPSVNISENEHSFDVELAAPGMEKQDF